MSFSALGVPEALEKALGKLGITLPMPVQVAAYPVVQEGRHAYLLAQTGTGKTLAYLLPLFSRLDLKQEATQLVIIAPTHELAIQIQRQCTDLAQHASWPVRALLLIGGTAMDRQLEKLKKKPHIAVGSPGRIRDLIEMGKLKVHAVKAVVVDEADRMMVPESMPAIQAILKATPQRRQLVFASATQRPECMELIKQVAPDFAMVEAGTEPVNPNIEHLYLTCDAREKVDVLRKLWHAVKPERTIIFVHKNERADVISNKLSHHKIEVADLHGACSRDERKRAMEDFRSGRAQVLIASDIAARGLDFKAVTHIFNLDPPSESKAYLHRAGRTGRAGAAGTAITLISGIEERLVIRYENELGIHMRPVRLREGRLLPVDPVDAKVEKPGTP
jgi:superfamily II DNA/RNA helicase